MTIYRILLVCSPSSLVPYSIQSNSKSTPNITSRPNLDSPKSHLGGRVARDRVINGKRRVPVDHSESLGFIGEEGKEFVGCAFEDAGVEGEEPSSE